MFAKSVLVTGSNRGIGLEFIRQLAGVTEHLFAACRLPSEADALKIIADTYKHVIVLELDVTNETSISKAIEKIAEVTGENGLNCLINNAGINNKNNEIEKCTVESLQHLHEVHVIGPAMLVKGCLHLLKKASSLRYDEFMAVSRASIINISSGLASIELNSILNNLQHQKADSATGLKLYYEYRLSKTALNMLTKNLSIELKADNILAVNVHPGWVQTRLGGDKAVVTPCQSVQGMLKVLSDFNETNNGLFYDWNGEALPW